ncbi:MarR family winged helix-turn-helix transcriptional regulator [Streptomyces sp. NPDC050804]|uniref:MarR family winged helix-turn-helix transcriptional regulator n=1 Tax=Streptomyces sp. NPDC050804 TaxID=3154745 RepID=UPI00342A3833
MEHEHAVLPAAPAVPKGCAPPRPARRSARAGSRAAGHRPKNGHRREPPARGASRRTPAYSSRTGRRTTSHAPYGQSHRGLSPRHLAAVKRRRPPTRRTSEAPGVGVDIKGHFVMVALTTTPMAQLELSALVKIDESVITATLDSLEAKGLVVRVRDLQDRRVRRPTPTPPRP